MDTSVLAAYYCPEPRSEAAQRGLVEAGRPSLSLLVEVEFHSAVSIKLRSGELDRAAANRVVSVFRIHLEEGHYARLPVDDRHFTLARDWIGRFDSPLRTLDALHLSLAFSADLPLLTADRRLASAAELLGVPHELLE